MKARSCFQGGGLSRYQEPRDVPRLPRYVRLAAVAALEAEKKSGSCMVVFSYREFNSLFP